MVSLLCSHTKTHWVAYSKGMNIMVCELHRNKIVTKKPLPSEENRLTKGKCRSRGLTRVYCQVQAQRSNLPNTPRGTCGTQSPKMEAPGGHTLTWPPPVLNWHWAVVCFTNWRQQESCSGNFCICSFGDLWTAMLNFSYPERAWTIRRVPWRERTIPVKSPDDSKPSDHLIVIT